MPSDRSAGSFGTLLFGLMCPFMDDMIYWKRLEALGGDSYDYEEGVDSRPGSFDYDDPQDYEEWCAWNDVDIEEGYYNPFQPNERGGFVSPGDVFETDIDTVVVASVVCEVKQADVQILESPDLCSDNGSGPRKVFLELRDMLDGPDFVNAGLAGTSQASGDTSDPSVSVGMVDSGPGPPVPEFWVKLKLPDFASDIDPGFGESFQRPGSISAWPAFIAALTPGPGKFLSGGILDGASFADDLATGSRKPFPKYEGVVWMQDSLDTRKEAHEVLLWELEVGLYVLTCTKGMDQDTGGPWPESSCRSDLLNFAGTFDPGLGQPFPRLDNIMGFPDSLDIGFDPWLSRTLLFGHKVYSRYSWPACPAAGSGGSEGHVEKLQSVCSGSDAG